MPAGWAVETNAYCIYASRALSPADTFGSNPICYKLSCRECFVFILVTMSGSDDPSVFLSMAGNDEEAHALEPTFSGL